MHAHTHATERRCHRFKTPSLCSPCDQTPSMNVMLASLTRIHKITCASPPRLVLGKPGRAAAGCAARWRCQYSAPRTELAGAALPQARAPKYIWARKRKVRTKRSAFT
eukprot:6205746-Pleurochrysis_carterae.AAC.2